MVTGRIVRIIDEYTLVANVGLEHGVAVGEDYVVVQPVEPVTEPETGAELGMWEMVKARLVVVHAQEKISTLMPLPEQPAHATVLSERMAWNSQGAPIGSRDVALPIDRTQMTGRRRTDLIRVGDTVKSVR
jgi:hypothetical protein